MNVELPSSGCNIIRGDSSFFNYSDDGHTRETYYIFGGEAFLESSTYSQYGFTHNGTCLETGDLVYRPELQIYFPLISFGFFSFVLIVIWRVILRNLLP